MNRLLANVNSQLNKPKFKEEQQNQGQKKRTCKASRRMRLNERSFDTKHYF